MKIIRNGITRICNKADYERRFKSLGYEVVGEIEAPFELDLSELGYKELQEMAKEKGLEKTQIKKAELLKFLEV